MNNMISPTVLIILDGWGYREETLYNAIAQAKTPTWDKLWQSFPHVLLQASSDAVGLPLNQIGNSEVGHMHMGAGRKVLQNIVRINQAIEKNDFIDNPVFSHIIKKSKTEHLPIHLVGLLSDGGVHSHSNHIASIANLFASHGIQHCYTHAILDGRDTPPQSAMQAVESYQQACSGKAGKILSIIGRYYAMDRDKRWKRTQSAYDLLTESKAKYIYQTAQEAIDAAYQRGETDEFIQATAIHHPLDNHRHTIDKKSIVLFMNFRADRMRQIASAFIQSDFSSFPRKSHHQPALIVSLTEYDSNFKIPVLFKPIILKNTVGDCLSSQGIKQLRIAETEKYAHVTFFFNGGQQHPFPGEDRILIPSPQVTTYDKKPEMSAYALTEALTQAILKKTHSAIICNYANADMVGHTGCFPSTCLAIETLDVCLSRIMNALKAVKGQALITADHGNAELMYNHVTQQPHTAHTEALVPCLYWGEKALKANKIRGDLYDIAPTFLSLQDIPIPSDMTGNTLFSAHKNQT